ncbi:hypothetical protein EVAR_10053_1 [Eumeta japonica]|uniref:Uncharacterized protein n=1 Tax=Eumeta variegata TaxID=151549 RepID=A0A4C1TR66_EUMVA|nr:hypothetical protein EVAR_10053_1 [Eumeta japonica]
MYDTVSSPKDCTEDPASELESLNMPVTRPRRRTAAGRRHPGRRPSVQPTVSLRHGISVLSRSHDLLLAYLIFHSKNHDSVVVVFFIWRCTIGRERETYLINV